MYFWCAPELLHIITIQMKKFLRKLHLWLSIPVGVIIFIVCLSGAMLVFQEEILHLVNPSHYYVSEVKGEPMPLDKLIPLVNEQLTENSVAGVQIFSDPERTYTMTLKEGFRVSAFVNPYTAEVTGYYYYQQTPFYTIMRIHRWLMDGTRTWGKYAVGISTMLFVIILITGLCVQPGKFFRKNTFVISRGKGKSRLLYDLHNVLGVYACILLLVGALTGLMWSFTWYRTGVFKLFGTEYVSTNHHGSRGGSSRGGGSGAGGQQKEKPLNVARWQQVFAHVKAENPDMEFIRMQDKKAAVHLAGSMRSRAVDTYNFDPRTGEIKSIDYYKDAAKSTRIWGWVYSLHVGNFWGIWSKILVFIAALIGASLPVTGYWMYFKKLSRKKKKA